VIRELLLLQFIQSLSKEIAAWNGEEFIKFFEVVAICDIPMRETPFL
jgi:hypothetical protein